MPLTEYKPGTSFPGIIGRTPDVSQPAWPQPTRAKEGAPNVLFIVLDDTGFAHLGRFNEFFGNLYHLNAKEIRNRSGRTEKPSVILRASPNPRDVP